MSSREGYLERDAPHSSPKKRSVSSEVVLSLATTEGGTPDRSGNGVCLNLDRTGKWTFGSQSGTVGYDPTERYTTLEIIATGSNVTAVVNGRGDGGRSQRTPTQGGGGNLAEFPS
jgi:hypothetical protein